MLPAALLSPQKSQRHQAPAVKFVRADAPADLQMLSLSASQLAVLQLAVFQE